VRKELQNSDTNVIDFPKWFTFNMPKNITNNLRKKEEILHQTYIFFKLSLPFMLLVHIAFLIKIG